jgi:UDP-N-acetylmuramoyl-tripeptide--D-alanyl-D-alanine ligase
MSEPPITAPLWTSTEIVAATGGALAGEAFAATGVSIDTRTLEPGDLFVALAGVRDGHEFIDQALAKGAVAALAAKPGAGARILVGDVLTALEHLGVAARERAGAARRGAVTGSVGKTSVTQAIAAGLQLAGPSHTSVHSYNNHIGVPLTLARMPRGTRRAIFEIGMNHPGEIVPLSRMVRPEAAAITTVGPVHVEAFADGEIGVARAKAEIFAGMTPGGTAILNADNPWFDLLKAEAERARCKVWAFGSDPACEARLIDLAPQAYGLRIKAVLSGRAVDFTLRQTGVQWGLNSLAVLLMLEALDVDLDTGLQALSAFAPLEGRGVETTIAMQDGDFILIDDSFNANSLSTIAALKTLGGRRGAGRRIVALTDMLELGEMSAGLHAALAEPIEDAKVDLVFCAGPLMRSLWEALPPTRRGGYADSAAELEPQLAGAIRPGDVVLVKGSKGSKASVLAKALAGLVADAEEMG